MDRYAFAKTCSLFVALLCTQASAQYDHEGQGRVSDPDGIGKWYMGREIAHTMSAVHADWLDRAEREQEEEPARLIELMRLGPDEHVADIGCGTGQHVMRIAKQVGKGKVYAVDIQSAMLDSVRVRAEASGFDHVELVLGSLMDPGLPEARMDKVLMVDVYHELEFPKEMMEAIVRSMKVGGMLYLVEFRKEDERVPIKPLHKMTKKQAIKEMEAVGLFPVRVFNGLPWQHVLLFRKPR